MKAPRSDRRVPPRKKGLKEAPRITTSRSRLRPDLIHRRTATQWDQLPESELMLKKISSLPLRLRQSPLWNAVQQVQRELHNRDLLFRPHFWLSDDWYCPDGVTGVALPFYMAHPRLMRLEKKHMLECEGEDREEMIRILRHEVGHALENAFRLRRRKERQKVFGKSSQKYPVFYSPKPYSKKFVLHLESWYAQSHPDEDFAETFAVWLDPKSDWKQRYADWPALKKLNYLDKLMQSLRGVVPPVVNKERVDPLRSLNKTLTQHYIEKRERFGLNYPNFYDRELGKLFSDAAHHHENMTAAYCLRKIRVEVRRKVAQWTGEYQYTIDHVIRDIIDRCEELDLRLKLPFEQTKIDFTVLLTVQTMSYLHSGRHRVAL